MLLIVRGTVWLFLKVAVFGPLVSPTTWLPNDKVEGVKLACAKAGETKTRRDRRAKTAPQRSFVQ
jgi:hypothetical protein